MTIFGLSLLQVFLLVLVVALAIVGAEQIRTHVLNPLFLKARAWLTTTETSVATEFETLLGHAKATAAALPGGSTVDAKSGGSAVSISTPVQSPPAEMTKGEPQTPLDPTTAVVRYIAAGMTPNAGMPTLGELLYLFGLTKPAQVAWGAAVALEFAQRITTPFSAVQVGDVGAVRPEAAAYLEAIGSGYPIIGTTSWAKV